VLLIADEPNATQFDGLRDVVRYLRERDADRLAYVNLLSIYIKPAMLHTKDYATYLGRFVDTVQPSLLSYDLYPFQKHHGDWHQYLECLAVVADKAKQANIPFMNVVQAGGWDTSLRIPNANELRYQVYTTLAYGAQGICYFNSRMPTRKEEDIRPVIDAASDPIYPLLIPLNKEFKNIASEYRSLHRLGNYLQGYRIDAMPPGAMPMPKGAPFRVSDVPDAGSYREGDPLKGVLIGCFGPANASLAEATVAMIVNLDYTIPLRRSIAGPDKISVFDASAGIWKPNDQSCVELTLPPGGGVLIRRTPAMEQNPSPKKKLR
jgi:hypothetical protein